MNNIKYCHVYVEELTVYRQTESILLLKVMQYRSVHLKEYPCVSSYKILFLGFWYLTRPTWGWLASSWSRDLKIR